MYEELVKELRKESCGAKTTTWWRAADAIEKLQVECQDWYEAYMDLLPTRWYSVKECLPNNEEDALIYGEWTGASGTKYREVWLTDLKEFLHQGYKPIAWMPLPTPPKEETE